MAFTFKPAIYKNSGLYELPRPVTLLRVQDAWDWERFKVPLQDGDHVVGHSREAVDIQLRGHIGTADGSILATEQDMLTALESLRSVLDVSVATDKFDFYLYHDAATTTYRHFKQCSTVRFDYDLSNPRLFSYSATLHAEDPHLYATGPEDSA